MMTINDPSRRRRRRRRIPNLIPELIKTSHPFNHDHDHDHDHDHQNHDHQVHQDHHPTHHPTHNLISATSSSPKLKELRPTHLYRSSSFQPYPLINPSTQPLNPIYHPSSRVSRRNLSTPTPVHSNFLVPRLPSHQPYHLLPPPLYPHHPLALINSTCSPESYHHLIRHQISDYIRISTPSQQLLDERSRLISYIHHVINRSLLVKNSSSTCSYPIQIFGSISFGLDSLDSDMDLCILDPARPRGITDPSEASNLSLLPKLYNVNRLARVLDQANFQDVKSIPMARTPIVKFQSPNRSISVDLNCNNLLGCRNSHLIRAYHHLSPNLFRPLAMIIKRWAKSRGYCDPAGRHGPISASSYTLILLLIAYLQVINHLPNLQDPNYLYNLLDPIRPSNLHCDPDDSDLIYILKPASTKPNGSNRPPMTRGGRKPWMSQQIVSIDTSFVERPPKSFDWLQTYPHDPSSHQPDRSIAKVLIGFFEFYSNFDFATHLISIRDGKPLRREPPFDRPSPPLGSTRRSESVVEKTIGSDSPEANDDDDDEDQITYVPFKLREGIPEHTQRVMDSIDLKRSSSARDLKAPSQTAPSSTIMTATTTKAVTTTALTMKTKLVTDEQSRDLSQDLSKLSIRSSSSVRDRHVHHLRSSSTSSTVSSSSSSVLQSNSASCDLEFPDSIDRHLHPRLRRAKDRDPTVLSWTHPIVVVDPFLYDRNTAGNIKLEVFDQIRQEIHRARRILSDEGSIDDLCRCP